MKLLGKFCGSLLVLVITFTVSAYIFSGTLLNAKYLENKANSTHLYDSLVSALPGVVAGDASPTDQQAISQGLSGVLTNSYIQQKVNPFLNQLQDYYEHNGPAPQIDLSDLTTQLTSQGVTIPPGSGIDKPIVYKDPTGIKNAFVWLNVIKIGGPILALLLITAMMFIYQGFHRFTSLAKVAFTAAVTEGAVYLLLKAVPGLLESIINSKTQTNAIVTLLVNFFKSLFADVATDFGKAAIGLAVAGAVIIILGIILKSVGAIGAVAGIGKKTPEPETKFARPNPENRPPV